MNTLAFYASLRSAKVNYRQVISDAWKFTRENKPLMMWYSFLPALLTTLVGILYLIYQYFAFKKSELFTKGGHGVLFDVIKGIWDFAVSNKTLVVPLGITAVIVLILYLLLPTLCQGGVIQIIARRRHGQNVKNIDGISFGMLAFLPMLEYHLLVKTFSFVTVFTESSFVIRNLGPSAFRILLPFFILMLVIGLVLSLLFAYSEFFIVLEKQGVFRSMLKSASLVILNWQHTLLIGILMLIIGIRVIVNVLAVLLVPGLIILSAGLLATVSLAKVGIIIGVVVGFIGLIFTAYMNGILHLFANTVWTYTFLELQEEKKKLESALPVSSDTLPSTEKSAAGFQG